MKSAFAFLLGLLLTPIAIYLYFAFGKPPVATGDKPFPMEQQIVDVPLHARIDREAPKSSPVPATPETYIAGAAIYRRQCASCHGLQGHDSKFAETMFPGAPQLWVRHHAGKDVGVSDDPVGETYWKVANGIRLSGMPAYKSILSDTEMWQVSQLLANAASPLPDEAVQSVSKELTY